MQPRINTTSTKQLAGNRGLGLVVSPSYLQVRSLPLGSHLLRVRCVGMHLS